MVCKFSLVHTFNVVIRWSHQMFFLIQYFRYSAHRPEGNNTTVVLNNGLQLKSAEAVCYCMQI